MGATPDTDVKPQLMLTGQIDEERDQVSVGVQAEGVALAEGGAAAAAAVGATPAVNPRSALRQLRRGGTLLGAAVEAAGAPTRSAAGAAEAGASAAVAVAGQPVPNLECSAPAFSCCVDRKLERVFLLHADHSWRVCCLCSV